MVTDLIMDLCQVCDLLISFTECDIPQGDDVCSLCAGRFRIPVRPARVKEITIAEVCDVGHECALFWYGVEVGEDLGGIVFVLFLLGRVS